MTAERVTVGAAELAELIRATTQAAAALQWAEAEIGRLRAALAVSENARTIAESEIQQFRQADLWALVNDPNR
jgi:hypothetical protein